MEYDSEGPIMKPLLLVGGQSLGMGTRKELLPLPDGRLAFEGALETLHDVLPSARTIYVSVHDEIQFEALEARLKEMRWISKPVSSDQDHHDQQIVPEVQPIFDHKRQDIGPAAGLLAAHSKLPDSKWIVLGCGYPVLPPPALQQLILEFQPPITCFVNESGLPEPLIGIWDAQALETLKGYLGDGRNTLEEVIPALKGKLVNPLRNEWIMGTNTKEEWEEGMEILRARGGIPS
ncbi:bifunctional molybdenum cofactor biosynthesis protein [Halenospora varia]|nr:bifunctional molybdenum cofactor biosynthesis protein [Halenospora varia]